MTDAYNKYPKESAGTLIGNWYEERELRDLTGHGRNYPMHHVPKKEGEPAALRDRDGTDTRVHGTSWEEKHDTMNHNYGATTNPADQLRKVGRREELMKAQIHQAISNEIKQKTDEEEVLRNTRIFETTTQGTFGWQVPNEKIGKRVMKTQDGAETEANDEVWAVEHGIRVPKPRRPLEQLEEEVIRAQQPITLYSDTLKQEIFPVSATKGPSPFARSCGFTQPIQQTRGANGFQGNV
ncbi:unnamed protein product [Blepharisma stoltei]|uniref:Uncharacterized protein n=1 Tax=Blepharisma stoltei TaxID=1481888 RepID=A0AAU9J6S5_9CILI|nr:unnamed protein product [Blepharisma stoltei]